MNDAKHARHSQTHSINRQHGPDHQSYANGGGVEDEESPGAALARRPFVQLIYRFQREATVQLREFKHPLLEVRDIRKRAVILVAADKGLCGPLNGNLFRMAAQFDPESTLFIAAGRKAAQFVATTRRQLMAEFPYGDSPRFPEARVIAAFARDLFLKKEVDEVRILATRFVNTLTQHPVSLEFLPVGAIKGMKIPGAEPEGELVAGKEFLFEPVAEAFLSKGRGATRREDL